MLVEEFEGLRACYPLMLWIRKGLAWFCGYVVCGQSIVLQLIEA